MGALKGLNAPCLQDIVSKSIDECLVSAAEVFEEVCSVSPSLATLHQILDSHVKGGAFDVSG